MATSVDLLAKIESFEIDGPDAPDLKFAARRTHPNKSMPSGTNT